MEDLEQEQLKKPKLNAKSAEWFEEIQQQDYIRSITVTPQHQFHLIKFTLSNSHFVFHFHFSFKNIYYLFTFFDFFCFISGWRIDHRPNGRGEDRMEEVNNSTLTKERFTNLSSAVIQIGFLDQNDKITKYYKFKNRQLLVQAVMDIEMKNVFVFFQVENKFFFF